jgi:mitogen-activated protein kinase kinase
MSVPTAGYIPPANPLRTKRNFKALVIDDNSPSRPPPSVPVGPVAGKRRPPPLEGGGYPGGLYRPPLDPTFPVDSPARRSAMIDRIAKLDLKKDSVVPKLDLKKEDLKKLTDIGHGNGGSVEKVEYIPTGAIMAQKVRNPSRSFLSNYRHVFLPLDRYD